MQYINFKRIAYVGVFFVIALCAAYFYIKHTYTTHNSGPLSSLTMTTIDNTVNRVDFIVGLIVTDVNFETNSRRIIYVNIKLPELKQLYTTFVSTNVYSSFPFFTQNSGTIQNPNNAALVKILNHEFVCTPYKDSITSKYAPTATKYVSTVCTVSVPPTYGDFYGMVSVYASGHLSEDQLIQLRILMTLLSDQIHRDLRPHRMKK